MTSSTPPASPSLPPARSWFARCATEDRQLFVPDAPRSRNDSWTAGDPDARAQPDSETPMLGIDKDRERERERERERKIERERERTLRERRHVVITDNRTVMAVCA